MGYNFKSNIYMIPMMAYGDKSSGAENAHAGNIIDNNLALGARATNFFQDTTTSLVALEGTYSSTYSSGDGTFNVSLSSLEGVIDNIHIKSTSNKTWSGIATNSTTYLFAGLIEQDYNTSSRAKGSWTPISDSLPTTSSGRLLLAKVVTSGVNSYIYSSTDVLSTKKAYSGILPGYLIKDSSLSGIKLASGSVDSTKVNNTIPTKTAGTWASGLNIITGSSGELTTGLVNSGMVASTIPTKSSTAFASGVMLTTSSTGVLTSSASLRITPDGGIANTFTAGEALNTGEVVSLHSGIDSRVIKTAISGVNPVGIVYSGVASGTEAIVVHTGIANVLFDSASASSRGFHVYPSKTTAGRATCYSGIDSANSEAHVGHAMESKSVGNLVKCILQF